MKSPRLQSVTAAVENEESDIPPFDSEEDYDEMLRLKEELYDQKHVRKRKRVKNLIAYFTKKAAESGDKQFRLTRRRLNFRVFIAFTLIFLSNVLNWMDISKEILLLSLAVSVRCIFCIWHLNGEIIENNRSWLIFKPRPIFPGWLMLELIELDYLTPVLSGSCFTVSDLMKRSYSVGCLRKSTFKNQPDAKRKEHVRRRSTGGNNLLEYSDHAALRKRLKTNFRFYD